MMRRVAWVRAFCLFFAIFSPNTSIAAAIGTDGFRYLQSLDQRVANTSWRIATRNLDICPRHQAALGLSFHNAVQYDPAYREAAISTFGFRDGLPAILTLADGSPAAAAGLKVDDLIIAVNGMPVEPSVAASNAKADYASIDRVNALFEGLPSRQPVVLRIRRDAEVMSYTVVPATACRSRVEIVPGQKINAGADGNVVQVYGRLVTWVRNDDELAIVVSHEMAHNILGHNDIIEKQHIGTGLLASLGQDGKKLREMELQADGLGLYLAARAGYDVSQAGDFWRRLTNTSGLGALWGTTHPTSASRQRHADAIVSEIRRKTSAGEALLPETTGR